MNANLLTQAYKNECLTIGFDGRKKSFKRKVSVFNNAGTFYSMLNIPMIDVFGIIKQRITNHSKVVHLIVGKIFSMLYAKQSIKEVKNYLISKISILNNDILWAELVKYLTKGTNAKRYNPQFKVKQFIAQLEQVAISMGDYSIIKDQKVANLINIVPVTVIDDMTPVKSLDSEQLDDILSQVKNPRFVETYNNTMLNGTEEEKSYYVEQLNVARTLIDHEYDLMLADNKTVIESAINDLMSNLENSRYAASKNLLNKILKVSDKILSTESKNRLQKSFDVTFPKPELKIGKVKKSNVKAPNIDLNKVVAKVTAKKIK